MNGRQFYKAALRLMPAGLNPWKHPDTRLPPDSTTARRYYTGSPQNLFRIEGLWLWGTDGTTMIHSLRPSCNMQGYAVSHDPIPGKFFEAGLSFDEFERLISDNSLADPRGVRDWRFASIKEPPRAPPHQILKMLTAEIGNMPLLDIEGPCQWAVCWGTTIS